MKEIPLRNKAKEIVAYALVDDEDYDWLMQWKWHLTAQGYAATHPYKGGGRGNPQYNFILMHRLIAGTGKGEETDHEDRNKLNNQRYNLRRCSPIQNMRNKAKQINTKKPVHETDAYGRSNFKGVCRHQNKWRARIKINGKKTHIGLFSTEVEAAKAYDELAARHFGEYAYLNFPEDHQ